MAITPFIDSFNPDSSGVAGDDPSVSNRSAFWDERYYLFRPAPGADPVWEVPVAQRSPWDLVWFGGDVAKLITGFWKVNTKLHHRVDLKKTPGKPGATPTFLGGDPAEVDATVQMWTRQHLAQYRTLATYLRGMIDRALAAPRGTPDKENLAIEIFHPSLDLIGISKVFVVDIGAPRPSSTVGVFEAVFRFTQFIQAAGTPSTARGTQPPVGIVDTLTPDAMKKPQAPHQDPKQSAP